MDGCGGGAGGGALLGPHPTSATTEKTEQARTADETRRARVIALAPSFAERPSSDAAAPTDYTPPRCVLGPGLLPCLVRLRCAAGIRRILPPSACGRPAPS